MFSEDHLISLRILALMIAASGAYALWWPRPEIGNVFVRWSLNRTPSKVIGTGTLIVAVALFVLTFV
jgi:hypothetical protein